MLWCKGKSKPKEITTTTTIMKEQKSGYFNNHQNSAFIPDT
jgi:hypothetical protein